MTGDSSSAARRAVSASSAVGGHTERWVPYAFLVPALIFVLGILGYGVVSGFITSLHSTDPFTYVTTFAGFRTYLELFRSPRFQNSLLRSTYLVLGSVALGMLVSMTFGLCLNQLRRVRTAIRGVSLVPWMVSGIAAAMMFRFMFSGNVGLVRFFTTEPVTWTGHPVRAMVVLILTNTWYISPFSTLILFSGLQTIDPTFYDAAAVDGASPIQVLFRLTIPLIKPMIGVALIWLSFASFNMFDVVLPITAGGPGRATEVLALVMYRFAFNELNYPMATAIMMTLLIINVGLSVVYLKLFKM